MQVMPATGKDMRVGDITQLEANVHAGVKYIRNVEVVAAESIGRETVQYVAYKMLMDEREQRGNAREEAAGEPSPP